MIWPFSAIANWAEEQAVKDAQKAAERTEAAKKRLERKSVEQAEKSLSMMKKIVIFCLANGVAWVWCSYILAFLGHEAIAESLSQVALAEIVGVVLTYAIKSVIENLSKNNNWPDKCEVVEGIEYVSDAEAVGYDNEEDFSDGPAVS